MRTRAHIRLLPLILLAGAPTATALAQDTTVRAVRPPLTTVRTFALRHLSADDAILLVRPYAQGPGATVSGGPRGLSVITVRADQQTLAAIERLISEFDRAPASITFRFQLIVATDASPRPDPAIAGVEPLLRDLFRFGGYRLLSQAALNAIAGSNSSQTVGDGPERMNLSVTVDNADVQGTTGSVRVRVSLSRRLGIEAGKEMRETLLSTGLTIPLGQTVVLGSAVADLGARLPDAKALILTVQPELAKIGR